MRCRLVALSYPGMLVSRKHLPGISLCVNPDGPAPTKTRLRPYPEPQTESSKCTDRIKAWALSSHIYNRSCGPLVGHGQDHSESQGRSKIIEKVETIRVSRYLNRLIRKLTYTCCRSMPLKVFPKLRSCRCCTVASSSLHQTGLDRMDGRFQKPQRANAADLLMAFEIRAVLSCSWRVTLKSLRSRSRIPNWSLKLCRLGPGAVEC